MSGSRRLRAPPTSDVVVTSPSIASGILLGAKYRIERDVTGCCTTADTLWTGTEPRALTGDDAASTG